MLMRRKLPVSILIAGMLTFIAVLGVGAQQADLEGSANFRDSNAVSDSLVLALTGVPAPPSGSVYEGWLKGGSGALVSTGVLSHSIEGVVNHTYQSPTNANLLATYSQFVITEEPASDPDAATPGTVIWSDTVPAGVFPHIGPLLVSATDAGAQAQVAADHTALARTRPRCPASRAMLSTSSTPSTDSVTRVTAWSRSWPTPRGRRQPAPALLHPWR